MFVLEWLLIFAYSFERMLFKIKTLSAENQPEAITEYRRLMVIQTIGRESTSVIIFMTMGVGYCVILFYASVSITCFETMPIVIYWVFPCVTAMCVVMVISVIPYASYCSKFSKNMIREWKQMTASDGSAYKRRILRTLQPIGFYFGSFRELNEESKTEYVQSLTSRLVDVVLCMQSA